MSPFGIVLILVSYLVGAIPFGLLLSMRTGVDIRNKGSKNIGATNVGRLLGRKLGIMTLLFGMIAAIGINTHVYCRSAPVGES